MKFNSKFRGVSFRIVSMKTKTPKFIVKFHLEILKTKTGLRSLSFR